MTLPQKTRYPLPLGCELDDIIFHLYLDPEDKWRRQPEALPRNPDPVPRTGTLEKDTAMCAVVVL